MRNRALSERIPSGHNQTDGGYSLLPPSPTEHDALTVRVARGRDELLAWREAANRLIRAYGVAHYGTNQVMHQEINDAEAAYDAAKLAALATFQ
jgi:hypothetical protein